MWDIRAFCAQARAAAVEDEGHGDEEAGDGGEERYYRRRVS